MSATCSTSVRQLLFLWLIYIYSTICPAGQYNYTCKVCNYGSFIFQNKVAVCTEGSLQLSGSAPGGRKFLQVCHIRDWRYVCNSEFDDTVDKEVVLQQLGCKTGGIIM